MPGKPHISEFDRDGDGTLDTEELREAYFSNGKNFKRLFDAVDDDGNGNLDYDEMTQFFMMIGRSHSDVKMLFRDFDVNGDGKISYSEFNAWLNKEYINKTFNVKQCEQAIGGTQREMADKAGKHKKVLDIILSNKKELEKVEAEMVPYREKRNHVIVALAEKSREAEEIRKQIEMISKEMHKQHEMMKIAMPARRAVSKITLMQLGHQKHHQSYGQLPRRSNYRHGIGSSVGKMTITRSSPLMNAGFTMSQRGSKGRI